VTVLDDVIDRDAETLSIQPQRRRHVAVRKCLLYAGADAADRRGIEHAVELVLPGEIGGHEASVSDEAGVHGISCAVIAL
jgi:hypothetical protein